MTDTQHTGPSSLHRKIAEIINAVDHVAKDGRNTQQNYSFVSEAAFLAAVRGEMADRNVTVFPCVLPDTVRMIDRAVDGTGKGYVTTCVVRYTFTDGDTGEQFSADVLTQGHDSLDKGAFKAMTGGIKYALRQVFLIPTGDDAENDSPAGASQGGGGRSERAEDALEMNILPPDLVFNATIREAAWVQTGGKDKIVAIAGVRNPKGGPDAGEKLWLAPGEQNYDEFVQVVCAGEIPPVGTDLGILVGNPLALTITLNGQYRNYTIGAPIEAGAPA